jgi:hypothetical protein
MLILQEKMWFFLGWKSSENPKCSDQVFGNQPGKMFKRSVICALAIIGETAAG